MKAMLFAAGVGSRLGKITENTPKPLIQAGGKAMIEHVIHSLKSAGVSDIIINLHYLGGQIEDFIRKNNSFDINIQFSREDVLLGTGGGLKNAATFFNGEESFFIYNADIFCDLDLRKLLEYHKKNPAIATLVTMKRETSRYLLFDKNKQLNGWTVKEQVELINQAECEELAFSGIHVVSPEIFKYMENEKENFSIINTYMNAAKAGEKVQYYNLSDEYWIDMGKPESLEELRAKLGR